MELVMSIEKKVYQQVCSGNFYKTSLPFPIEKIYRWHFISFQHCLFKES